MKMQKLSFVVCAALAAWAGSAGAAAPEVTPALKEWQDAAAPGAYRPGEATRVVVAKGADKALALYARTFAHELGVAFAEGTAKSGDIALAVAPADGLGREGYALEVRPDGVRVTAPTALGAWWATRTLRQAFDRAGACPAGTARDWPDYPVRGFMFDCGRKPFARSTLKAIVDICSYYKVNDLQLHLSDNYIWLHNYPGVRTAQDILAYEPTAGGFRLESKVKGLASADLCYTKEDFRRLVSYARKRGVKIVPELDVPGHALQFVRVRPDLMYRGSVGHHKDIERAAMLDLSNPQTFDFVASVFDEYIDEGVFANDVVHIGTDEYYGDAESYRAFADRLLRHIRAKGKTPRLWGSLSRKRGKTSVVSEGVEMHIWSMDWQKPLEAVNAGYRIINILDRYAYAVPNGRGNVGAYCDDINAQWLYENWTPRTFPGVTPEQLPKAQVLGGAWALWNDNSFLTDPGLCGRDLLARIRKNCAAVAVRTWAEAAPSVPYAEFLAAVQADAARTGTGEPVAWARTFRAKGGDRQPLAQSDEIALYGTSPVDGKVGFRREGAFYSFDYVIPAGQTVTLEFASADRQATLKVDGKSVGGVPRRQHFPEACRYFTLPEPPKAKGR